MNKLINQVLHSYSTDTQNWELSSLGKEAWVMTYFNKLKLKNMPLAATISGLKQYYASDLSEKSFKSIFGAYLAGTSPFISLAEFPMQLTNSEVQKVAFKLSNHLSADYDSIYFLLKRLYYNYPKSAWNYETFMSILGSYDAELKAQLLVEEVAA